MKEETQQEAHPERQYPQAPADFAGRVVLLVTLTSLVVLLGCAFLVSSMMPMLMDEPPPKANDQSPVEQRVFDTYSHGPARRVPLPAATEKEAHQ